MRDTDEEKEAAGDYSEVARTAIVEAVKAEGKKGGTWADKLAVAKDKGYTGSIGALSKFMLYHVSNGAQTSQKPPTKPTPKPTAVKPTSTAPLKRGGVQVGYSDTERAAIIQAATMSAAQPWKERLKAAQKVGFRAATIPSLMIFIAKHGKAKTAAMAKAKYQKKTKALVKKLTAAANDFDAKRKAEDISPLHHFNTMQKAFAGLYRKAEVDAKRASLVGAIDALTAQLKALDGAE